MRVLGFDPGTATTGYGVVDGNGTRLIHIAHGVISTPPTLGFAERLRLLFEQAQALIAEHGPDSVAVEKLFFSQNVSTGIGVAQARGVIALAGALAGLPIGEFSPLEVKSATVGYGKATKRQVQEMVKVLLNLADVPRPDDAADALGLAICQVQTGLTAARFEAVYRAKGSSSRKSGR